MKAKKEGVQLQVSSVSSGVFSVGSPLSDAQTERACVDLQSGCRLQRETKNGNRILPGV